MNDLEDTHDVVVERLQFVGRHPPFCVVRRALYVDGIAVRTAFFWDDKKGDYAPGA